MRRFCALFFCLLTACGGNSTGTTSAANVKITGIAQSGAVNVENIGGAGGFYLEFWGRRYLNPPAGTPNPVIRLASSPTVAVSPGYRGALADPIGSAKIVAMSRGRGGSGFYTSDCYGSC